MGTFEVTIETERRRVRLRAEGALDGLTFRRAMEGWIPTAAGIFTHHRLYDLHDYAGTVTNDDVRHVGRLMRAAGADTAEGCTAFVTYDAGFAFWVRAMRLELPRRRMEVVRTMEAAEALLA